jgi:hypothetical protein
MRYMVIDTRNLVPKARGAVALFHAAASACQALPFTMRGF